MGPRNIIVLGETGTGKSSLINMICGPGTAKTSDEAKGCTFETKLYYDEADNRYYDTAGFNEPTNGTVSAKDAMKNLTKLLRSLTDGVNLLIFVIRKGRITDTMVRNYTIFVKGICQSKVPTILAISGCEMDTGEDIWYLQNKANFEINQMQFDDVISGCFSNNVAKMKPGAAAVLLESFDETKARLDEKLADEAYDEPQNFGSVTTWMKQIFGSVWNPIAKYFSLSQIAFNAPLSNALQQVLKMDPEEAKDVANSIVQQMQEK